MSGALTIVIPTYNESARLPRSLATLQQWMDDATVPGLERVIVSDDGSTDGTADLATRLTIDDPRCSVLRGPVNLGKGAALRRGFAEATTDLVAFVDADLPIPSDSLLDLVSAAAGADLVTGTRVGGGTVPIRSQPLVRRLGGRAFVRLVVALGFSATSDPQCGAKILRRAPMQATIDACRSDRFAFDVEMISIARANGLDVVECPVRWVHVPGSTVRPVRDLVATVVGLIRLRRGR